MKFVLNTFLCFVTLTSCGKTNSKKDGNGTRDSNDALPAYNPTPLSGKIGGRDWTFKTGIIKQNHFDPQKYDLHFYGVEISEPCESFNIPWSADKIMDLSINLKLGETDYSSHKPGENFETMTILDDTTPEGPHNYTTDRAKYTIDSIDETLGTVSGKLMIQFNENNAVNGTFTATLCKNN